MKDKETTEFLQSRVDTINRELDGDVEGHCKAFNKQFGRNYTIEEFVAWSLVLRDLTQEVIDERRAHH